MTRGEDEDEDEDEAEEADNERTIEADVDRDVAMAFCTPRGRASQGALIMSCAFGWFYVRADCDGGVDDK